MIVLGIDPGYGRLGIAVVSKDKKEELVYSCCLETDAKENIYERFKIIGKKVTETIEKYKPDALAVETLFISKNQKTGMRVAEIRGIVIYEAIRKNIPVYEYSPLQIKMAITGDGRSDKSRIIKMLNLLIKLPKRDQLDDEYDAIAVALCHLASIR